MKRRSVALVASAFALALTMPAVASAESVSELRILGHDMLAVQGCVACGEGEARYDASTNTLTLEDATIEAGNGNGIQFTGPLTIELVGSSRITSAQRGIYGNGVEADAVNITGAEGASLAIESGWEALQVDDTTAPATLAIDGVTLEAASAARSGIVLEGLSLEIGEGASVTADSAGTSVKTDQDITVSEESSLHATSDGSYGVRADGDIAVTDATLSATSTSVAVWARGSVSVSDAEVTTESAPNSLRSEGTLSVSGDSVVTAVGGVFGEKGVSVAPVDGEKVDLWLGASEAEAAHYESTDGSLRSPFDAPVTLNSYSGLSGAAYVRILRHVHSGDPATCTSRAVCQYCGEQYGELDLTNHSWGAPSWQWYEGGSVCAAAFPCEYDATHLKVMYAEVSSEPGKAPTCTEKGTTVYEAELTFEGKPFTTTTELEDVSALGHTTETVGAKEPTCSEEGYSGDKVCTVCGETVEKGEALAKLSHDPKLVGAKDPTTSAEGYTGDTVCSVCGETIAEGETIPKLPIGTKPMYRLYNRWSGEHFYTGNPDERTVLVDVGWTDEGVGWYAPEEGASVYRLYNPYVEGGDHHYTMSAGEYDALAGLGWKKEGVCWHSADELDDSAVSVWRQYNPYASTGTHNYTTSREENDALVELGWRHEGIAWYGVEAPEGK